MASGYTNSIGKDSGFASQIRLRYSTSFNPATNTSTVYVTPQLYCSYSLGNDIRFFSYGQSGAGVYGGATTSTSLLYSVSSDYGSGSTLRASGNSWDDMTPYSGSIASFTVKHDRNGSATFYGGVVGTVISMYNSSKSSYDSIAGNWRGCYATITESAPYSISYNANGGSGAPSSQPVYATFSYTLSSTRPTRTGYTFLGWSTSSTATTASYQPGASVTISGNLPLYAVWQINTYTISFDANGGEDAPGAVTKTYGVTLTLPTDIPTRTGYGFLGWSTDSSATTATYQAGGSFTANAATKLYAVWRVISYTLAATVSDRGITTNILRTASPIGGAASGLLADGDTVYYNDVIKVSWAISGGYQAETFQINGEDVSLLTEKTITVTEQPVIFLVVELGAMVYIGNDMYQAFINDGTGWSQYQAYIGNGSSWEAY